jgi:predicted chitinase
MIISPPFLPQSGLTTSDETDYDPMMTTVEKFEPGYHGVFPVTFDRRWHCGIHLIPDTIDEPVRAIADGEVVAYRVSQKPVTDGHVDENGQEVLNTNTGFMLLRHVTETGEGRTIRFYSLYMNLLDLTAQHRLTSPQPANPPPNTSPTTLAAWLLEAGDGVKPGGGKKVRRKDILGYLGQSQGLRHLHFEIFMTEEDFTAWFEQPGHEVQPGQKKAVQPTSKDWWGHAWYVIPGSIEFLDLPDSTNDTAHFPMLSRGKLPKGSSKLYVEAYFHKGQRFMRAWLDENGDGNFALLTPKPVKDKCDDYEYNLYERATKLYPACPSDGYELLRFGRILSDAPTLTAQTSRTWVSVPFDASGTQGYVDISKSSILKLSDADFPYCAGWQKIDETNEPLGVDGLFSYRKLRQLVGDATATAYEVSADDPKFSLDDQLSYFVQRNASVRGAMSGFVCHAKSEWDAANNDGRYGDLNRPDGFFGKRQDTDPDGYERFVGFLQKVQFMDQVPALAGGKKFWFFHPLAFIRHFRKCGWMDLSELAQVVPGGHKRTVSNVSNLFVSELRDKHDSSRIMRPAKLHVPLMKCMRKYGILTPLRVAHWFGQVLQETGAFQYMRELGDNAYFKNYYEGRCRAPVQRTIKGKIITLSPLGNCSPGDGARYSGKGMIQLTGGDNYRQYQAYRGGVNFTIDPGPESLINDANNSCDAGGYYWAGKQRMQKDPIAKKLIPLGKLGINFWADKVTPAGFENTPHIDQAIDDVSRCVNPGLDGKENRRIYFKHAYSFLSEISVGFPPEFNKMED